MVTVVVFEFDVMRCQPLRRALGNAHKEKYKCNFLLLLSIW
ncbi:acetyltransferase [Vibrio cholerae]|nr:acetyltransferase [Vibrio cholerae]